MFDRLARMFPDLQFCSGEQYCWSPAEKKITYCLNDSEDSDEAVWALLHETGHAALNHSGYKSDYELLKMEIDAWEKAKDLAGELGLNISEEHIQDCLDSYRDWLYRRSICPECGTKTIQNDSANRYSCYNCHTDWQVSPSRFCRAYRSSQTAKSPSITI
jgi:ribosomal protein S27AE